MSKQPSAKTQSNSIMDSKYVTDNAEAHEERREQSSNIKMGESMSRQQIKGKLHQSSAKNLSLSKQKSKVLHIANVDRMDKNSSVIHQPTLPQQERL